MIVRHEKITIVSYLISSLFLVLSALVHFSRGVEAFETSVYALFVVILVFYTAELLLPRLRYFLTILPFHIGAVFIVTGITASNNPMVEIVLIISLIFTISLRLPTWTAISINIFVLVVSAIIGVRRSVYLETLILFFVEAVFVSFCAVIIYYREALVGANRTLADQRNSLDNLSAANESIVQHLTEMKEESAEEERFRITRELHDSLGYSMTNIVMIMNAAQYIFEEDPEKVRDYCRKTKEMASATMEETRRTLYRLRALGREAPHNPSIFFDKLCRDFTEATGISTECHPGNFRRMLPERAFNTLFRAVQVGFINALKHGKTGKIRLHFWIGDEDLRMTVWNSVDNHTVDMSTLNEGIGIKGIRERLAELEGSLSLSHAADGFNLSITIPKKELVYEEVIDYDS